MPDQGLSSARPSPTPNKIRLSRAQGSVPIIYDLSPAAQNLLDRFDALQSTASHTNPSGDQLISQISTLTHDVTRHIQAKGYRLENWNVDFALKQTFQLSENQTRRLRELLDEHFSRFEVPTRDVISQIHSMTTGQVKRTAYTLACLKKDWQEKITFLPLHQQPESIQCNFLLKPSPRNTIRTSIRTRLNIKDQMLDQNIGSFETGWLDPSLESVLSIQPSTTNYHELLHA